MFVICSISQWRKRSKHGLFVFPPKKNLIWKKHCSIGQSCCSMMSKRSISWFLESSGAWSFFTRVRLTNILSIKHASNRSISGRLLFLFCSCIFISRSYENRSNKLLTIIEYDMKNYADGWLAFSRDHSSFSYKSWGQYYYYCILNFLSKYFLVSGKYLLKICLLLL